MKHVLIFLTLVGLPAPAQRFVPAAEQASRLLTPERAIMGSRYCTPEVPSVKLAVVVDERGQVVSVKRYKSRTSTLGVPKDRLARLLREATRFVRNFTYRPMLVADKPTPPQNRGGGELPA